MRGRVEYYFEFWNGKKSSLWRTRGACRLAPNVCHFCGSLVRMVITTDWSDQVQVSPAAVCMEMLVGMENFQRRWNWAARKILSALPVLCCVAIFVVCMRRRHFCDECAAESEADSSCRCPQTLTHPRALWIWSLSECERACRILF